jgi:hypothetical protein
MKIAHELATFPRLAATFMGWPEVMAGLILG